MSSEQDKEKEDGLGFLEEEANSLTATFQKYRTYVISFVISMPINCVILEVDWLHEPIKNNVFEHTFSLLFLASVFTMCMISYYFAITIESKPHRKSQPEQRANFYFYPGLKTDEICNRGICEKSWKPIRTHHCKVCKNCTLKMDHHCPWTVNCIGMNSHKAFYLTTIYWAMGGSQYLYRSYKYYYYIRENDQLFMELSTTFFIYWAYTTIIVFFITFMLYTLVYYHSLLAMSNMTSIEDKKGIKLCFGITDTLLMTKEYNFNLNFFDEGIIANLVKFLDNSYFFFWWPHKVIVPYDGEMFSMLPYACKGEIIRAKGCSNDALDRKDYYERLNDKTSLLKSNCDSLYKGKKLKFNEQMFQ